MQPPFIGNHPAIDFLNTTFAPEGEPVETIGDGRAFLEWMAMAGLLEATDASRLRRRLGAGAVDAAAAEARKIREWARVWLDRWRVAPRRDYRQEVGALNRLLGAAVVNRAVIGDGGGYKVIEQTRLEDTDAVLALVATQIADLITREQPSLVKRCAGPGCTLWFLDRTKAHARRFCSAAGCGNRAKVAAFRERRRGGEEGGAGLPAPRDDQ
jgi:predicted RNA-binding Zn ribbon-like protein